jgi:hypothetical protein
METCQTNEAISKNGGNMDAEPQSLLQRALQAISLQSGCETGLSSEPLMLFLLLMDDRTIEEQTPMGRYLLHQLSALVDSKTTRLQLIREARDLLLADSKYWDGLSRQSSQILQNFNACKRGRKAVVQVSCIRVCVCVKSVIKNMLTSKSHIHRQRTRRMLQTRGMFRAAHPCCSWYMRAEPGITCSSIDWTLKYKKYSRKFYFRVQSL